MYEEVISLVGLHGDFTPESFAKLDYLEACVKESMRSLLYVLVRATLSAYLIKIKTQGTVVAKKGV